MNDQTLTIRTPRDVIELVNSGIGRGSSIWILLIALGGIFTDAYDLTSFGIGVPQLRAQMHLSPAAIGTVSAAISVGAVIGALIGGYYVDKIGRLRMFLLDLVCFVVAAIGAAFSTDLWMLVFFRVIMGFGLGLDYPVALSFVAEYTATRRKSSSVGYWIIISSTCYVVFYLCVVLPLYLTGAGPNLWRWAVGLGAVPALIVLILRYIHMRESPMWAALQGDLHGAARILEKTYGVTNIRVEP
ncbi:MAG: MFS transporter, partial [Vulcanimicrobiaceae bacterium]